MKHLLARLNRNTLDCDLTRCFVRLLAASHQFPKELLFGAQSINSLRVFCIHCLKIACEKGSPLAIQNSLDCCTLVSVTVVEKSYAPPVCTLKLVLPL